jgi:hypothetical protein
VVERPEKKDSVERLILERKLACISDLCSERGRFSGLRACVLDVKGHGVDQHDLMADGGKP